MYSYSNLNSLKIIIVLPSKLDKIDMCQFFENFETFEKMIHNLRSVYIWKTVPLKNSPNNAYL